MTVKTSAAFDLESFRRGYEHWDVDALLALYADEVELIQIDRDNPPSSPRTRHGKEVFRGMFEHCAAAGVKATEVEVTATQKLVLNGAQIEITSSGPMTLSGKPIKLN
jgi:ketosteroid isomerase-like protein